MQSVRRFPFTASLSLSFSLWRPGGRKMGKRAAHHRCRVRKEIDLQKQTRTMNGRGGRKLVDTSSHFFS